MLKQVYTHLESLEMCEVSEGLLPVISVRIYQHAADPVGSDSWFLQVTAEGTSTEGGKCPLMFTNKATCNHGWPKAKTCSVAQRVLMDGELNLKHWDYVCNH